MRLFEELERRGRQGSAQLRKKYTGLKSPVLLLNRNYQPLRITDAKDAFTLLYVGRGHALDSRFDLLDFERWAAIPPEEGEEWVGTSRGPIRIPRVLVMLRALRSKEFPLRLCRENIFLRDEYACQYCGLRPGIEALNVDHVIPRSRGGTRTWENLVTSCRSCNLKKGRATPEECGMRLRTKPKPPTWPLVLRSYAAITDVQAWEPFLKG